MDRAIKDLIEKTEKERRKVHAQRQSLAAAMRYQIRNNTDHYLRLQRKEKELDERIRALHQARLD
jgi:hypothetical protein